MATKKTTKTEPKPKTYTLTEAQFRSLRNISNKLGDVRRALDETEGEDNLSRIMFQVGSSYTVIDWCEDGLDEVINSFESDEDDDEDLF